MFQRVLNGEANYGRRVLAVSSINQKEVGFTEPQDSTVSVLYMEVTFNTLLKFVHTLSHFPLRIREKVTMPLLNLVLRWKTFLLLLLQ
jgi:hypothetical protein